MQTVQSVIVLGGGTAGFLAAIALRTRMPDLPVRLIRSKEIGIIGVGESTTAPIIQHLFGRLKLNMAEFYREAKPIWKLGIHFIWGSRPSFNFSFAANMNVASTGRFPRHIGYYCQDDMTCTNIGSALMSQRKAFARNGCGLPAINASHAYHLENQIFCGYLEMVALRLGVQIFEDKVISVECGEHGVERLHLESGKAESAELFVDASGFVSELIGKSLKEPFESFQSSLFCDRAVVGGWERSLGELIQPYTVAETMNAGWCWRIDHERHINRGYVYSSSFISDEQATEEFLLQNPKIRQTRIVKFRTGRYRRSFVKNVVAIGNSSGFVEPLEATAIAAICEQTYFLATGLQGVNRQLGPKFAEAYNVRNGKFWDAIRRFLALHYKFNDRLDTPFWLEARANTDLAGAESIVENYEENGPDPVTGEALIDPLDQFGIEGYLTMLVGQQVPYRNRPEFSECELKAVQQFRQENSRNAAMGYYAEQALSVVRIPQWEWGIDTTGK